VHQSFSCSCSSRHLPGVGWGAKTSVSGPGAAPGGPDERNAQNEADDTEDNPPRQIRSGRREQSATPDDAADSRSIQDFSPIFHMTASRTTFTDARRTAGTANELIKTVSAA